MTDEVRVMIAAQAGLLVLGLDDDDPYRNVETIIVHATTVTLNGEQSGSGRHDEQRPVSGARRSRSTTAPSSSRGTKRT